MDELQAKLNRRLSRIDMMKSNPNKGEGGSADEGDAASQAQYKEAFDLRTADNDTLLELINICATSLPSEVFNNIVAKHTESGDAAAP